MGRMAEKPGLRIRFALFFAALGLAGVLALTVGLWFGFSRSGGPVEGYLTAGLIGGFGLCGVTAWIWFLFDENVARPLLGLASDLATRARSDVDAHIDEEQAKYLGALAPAANAIHEALAKARAEQLQAIELETARINRDKALFEALLHDLTEGAVVLTPDQRIMLYNRAARELLGNIGLDRPIGSFLRSEPLQHAIERLVARRDRGESEAERFLAATTCGNRFLLCRISPVTAGKDRVGYVVIFHDATDDLQSHAELDHLFNNLLEQVRRPTAAISALLDALEVNTGMPAQTRATFNAAMQEELARLFESIRANGVRYSAATAAHWPMSEVAAEDIFDALKARGEPDLRVESSRQFLRCDGYAIIGLLTQVIEGLAQTGTRSAITLAAEPHDREIWLTINWQGEEVPDGLIDGWVCNRISDAYGDYSGRDVLEGHRTEIWPERPDRSHRIVLPLPAAGDPVLSPKDARPEFYDFDLPPPDLEREIADKFLSELSFVVFDTETTGLSPGGGDEIIQIAGLRVVNGRVMTGEVFDTLVDPGRSIPQASTKVHGITDEMVRGAPDIVEAGNQFHAFCQDSVLVAHNAPFDLAFLRLKEEQIGKLFRHPVLCTVLLSAALFEHSGKHTLDALAERFGVTIPPHLRHTALGDATATAEVFLKMLDVMHGEGINTLGEAIETGQKMSRIRKSQKY